MLPSTRPYLVRALHAWCTDHGFTPYLQVQVVRGVQVPMEFVQDGVITLNVSYDATQGLRLDDEAVTFKARFGGVVREVMAPMSAVLAIYARENGQGMAFAPIETEDLASDLPQQDAEGAEPEPSPALRLAPVPTSSGDNPPPEPSPTGPRPALKRVK
ncbi:ClpXP protease specificity-enhancing factor [Inhella sp. 4Y17]|uniref:ClpXP protease specificity-enhancing factor n=1 Tax=Inhella gelatinilytica TaxID=2795030 RepID=A0A931J0F8_9BURK|nr:ClpXP protease specificity-enhancing factor [Inhella gelatinilytica]